MPINDADRFEEWVDALRKHACMLLNGNSCSKNEIDVLTQKAAESLRAEGAISGGDFVPTLREHLRLLCISLDGEGVQWFSNHDDWLAETEAKARHILEEEPDSADSCRSAVDAVRGYASGDSVIINGLRLHVGMVPFDAWYGPLPARADEARIGAVRELVAEGLIPGGNFGESPSPGSR